MLSTPSACAVGSTTRAAAISTLFGALANNGGLNSFLTSTCELDGAEVVESLEAIGGHMAADQLRHILTGLGGAMPPESEEARWERLDGRWTDSLDDRDVLSKEADAELNSALGRHVADNEAYYLALGRSDRAERP